MSVGLVLTAAALCVLGTLVFILLFVFSFSDDEERR